MRTLPGSQLKATKLETTWLPLEPTWKFLGACWTHLQQGSYLEPAWKLLGDHVDTAMRRHGLSKELLWPLDGSLNPSRRLTRNHQYTIHTTHANPHTPRTRPTHTYTHTSYNTHIQTHMGFFCVFLCLYGFFLFFFSPLGPTGFLFFPGT